MYYNIIKMNKIICEKSILNILFYRKHKVLTQNIVEYKNTKYEWIKNQSQQIDKMGFDNWYNNTTGPMGPPIELKDRKNPIYYKIINK
jgi:hypothetical protein